jgi:hypothetical protein
MGFAAGMVDWGRSGRTLESPGDHRVWNIRGPFSPCPEGAGGRKDAEPPPTFQTTFQTYERPSGLTHWGATTSDFPSWSHLDRIRSRMIPVDTG